MKKAFTLIELILSIAILVLIISIGVYNFNFLNEFKISKDIETIDKNLKFTRNLAIANKNKAQFIFINPGKYAIKSGSFYEEYYYSKDIKVDKSKYLNGNKVEFNKRGASINNSSQTIFLIYGDKKWEIAIEPVTGNINLRKVKKDLLY
ncbi:MAG: prepilin-type N-terminal cleavage/methylation domain-containing protein [Peptoniphilaceae bacterium]